jgi:hypothetical protein
MTRIHPDRIRTALRTMPPLSHWPDRSKPYRHEDSECLAWIAANHEVLHRLFQRAADRGDIVYDGFLEVWRGADVASTEPNATTRLTRET